jgi:hypothetical protein
MVPVFAAAGFVTLLVEGALPAAPNDPPLCGGDPVTGSPAPCISGMSPEQAVTESVHITNTIVVLKVLMFMFYLLNIPIFVQYLCRWALLETHEEIVKGM